MVDEVQKTIKLTIALGLLGVLLTVITVLSMLSRDSLDTYLGYKYTVENLPELSVNSGGTLGYYELLDAIDTYAIYVPMYITYVEDGVEYTMLYKRDKTGGTVRLEIYKGDKDSYDETPSRNIQVYSRVEGNLLRNGAIVDKVLLEYDLGIDIGEVDRVASTGVLAYEFSEELYKSFINDRFVCTILTGYNDSNIESIELVRK